LLFNIEKKIKHTEIEMGFQDIPYFLRAANADFLGYLLSKHWTPDGHPSETQ
jgi:hypothetical protein